jgi:epoxide hydrolase-like predicted phosphatase
MMPILAVYFDIGGVLVRTEDRTPRDSLAARLGISWDDLNDLVFSGEKGQQAQMGQIGAGELWENVRRALRLPPEAMPQVRQEFFSGDRLDNTLLDRIRILHQHYKTGIISNALDDTRSMIEGRWGMSDAFDSIIISAEVGVMKPEARIFHIALQSMGVQPGEAVFVDDFAHNVEGARAVGMHAIQFSNPEQVRQELEAILNHKF